MGRYLEDAWALYGHAEDAREYLGDISGVANGAS